MTTSKPGVPAADANTNAPKASVHSRFIPREEIASFASWNPGSLSGAGAAPSRPHAKPPQASAEDAAAALKAARQSGYQDGYRDGLAALEGFKQGYAAQVTAQVGALMLAMNTQYDALQQDMARAIAVSATQLARQVVRSELKTNPQIVLAVAHEALDTLLQSARHITLRVHPDEHALVAQGAAQALRSVGARLLADAGISRGGCLVESDVGVVDAGIELRWRRAAALLGCEDEWQAGADPSPAEGHA
jgi:flagellar assembly protein FliH